MMRTILAGCAGLMWAVAAVAAEGPGTFYVPPAGTANRTAVVAARPDAAAHRTVAFLGGSITEMNGFRPRVMARLREKFPNVAFTEIAAGLSSTCSDVAAFRFAEDVLSKGRPDLLIVDAAVNDDQDGHFTYAHCVRGMEGVLRQARRANPAMEIVVALFVNRDQFVALQKNETPVPYAAHRAVAERYGAAVADVGSALVAATRNGTFSWEKYRDCHPSPEGCDLGAGVVMDAICSVYDPCAKPCAHAMPKALDENAYSRAETVPFDQVECGAGWTVSIPKWDSVPGDKRGYFTIGPALWSVTTGATCKVSFTGTALAAVLTAGPDAGALEISVDGGKWTRCPLFMSWSEGLNYPYARILADDLVDAPHQAVLRVASDERKGRSFSAVRIHRLVVNGRAGKYVHVNDRDVYVHEVNYDKSKIPPYTLEDPLKFVDGRSVTKETWAARRKEILGIFAREMYGQPPPPPETVVTELVDEKVGAAAGFAIRRQYRMWFRKDRSGPCINWIVWIPRYAKKPVPVISFLNYNGNHELVPDTDVRVTDAWMRVHAEKNEAFEGEAARTARSAKRGAQQNPNADFVFPLGMILARGYAVMSACYAEVSPDVDTTFEPRAYTGVFDLWGTRDPAREDDITSIGAWGWALSRGLDLAERIPEIDARRSVVTGYSRLGKSALMAAARDERFAVCVPNQTGGGGVPLAKRDYGENISTENRMFTHWYCRAYAKYARDPHLTMPFDQHLFLTCVAPRALLVQGFDSKWFDTEGEYLALRAASPVWAMLTGKGLPDGKWPEDFETSAIGERLGYVRRSEGHGLSAYDWTWLMNFADRVFSQR